jgi:hypothetical protein
MKNYFATEGAKVAKGTENTEKDFFSPRRASYTRGKGVTDPRAQRKRGEDCGPRSGRGLIAMLLAMTSLKNLFHNEGHREHGGEKNTEEKKKKLSSPRGARGTRGERRRDRDKPQISQIDTDF